MIRKVLYILEEKLQPFGGDYVLIAHHLFYFLLPSAALNLFTVGKEASTEICYIFSVCTLISSRAVNFTFYCSILLAKKENAHKDLQGLEETVVSLTVHISVHITNCEIVTT